MKKLGKKVLTLLMAVMIVGLYTFGDVAAIFATTGSDVPASVKTEKTAKWVDKDQGIAEVNLKVKSTTQIVVHKKVTRVVLVLDRSGSMADNGKLASLKASAKDFVAKVLAAKNADVKVAVVSYSSDYNNRHQSSSVVSTNSGFSSDQSTLNNAIDGIKAFGGTNIQAGIQRAQSLMSDQNVGTDGNKFIVVLSDGEPTESYKATSWTKSSSTTWPYTLSGFTDEVVGDGSHYMLKYDEHMDGDYYYSSYDKSYELNDGYGYKGYVIHRVGNGEGFYYKDGNNYREIYAKYKKGFMGISVFSYNYYLDANGNEVKLELQKGDTVYKKYAKYITIDNNGYGTVSAAEAARNAGNTLYSIGFDIAKESTAKEVMQAIATPGNSYTAGSDLSAVFSKIAGSIAEEAAGSGAVVTDPIGFGTTSGSTYDFYNVDEDSLVVTAPNGMEKYSAHYDSKTHKISWSLGEGSLKAGTYTLTYRVKLHADDPNGDASYDLSKVSTNNGAVLNYTDGNNIKRTADFTDPKLDVTHYSIQYYYSDNGKDFNIDNSKTVSHTLAYDDNGTPSTKNVTDEMINAGNKAGYDYQSDLTKCGSSKGNTLTVVKDKSSNIIKLYYTKYKATGNAVLGATKNYNKPLIGNDFNFKIELANSDGVVKTGDGAFSDTAVNAASGNVAFAGLNYSESDIGKTYYYRMSEVAGDKAFITYSSEAYLAKVEVTDPNHNGTLNTEVTYYSIGSNGVSTTAVQGLPVFTNAYVTDDTTFTFSGTKVLNGRAMVAGEFHFTVKEGENTVATGTNTASSDGVASPITFTPSVKYGLADVGTHTYTITEDKSNKGGITYDSSSYNVVVKVVDDGQGKLSPELVSSSDSVAFSNTYTASGTEFNLTGTKKLTGKSMSDGEFTFSVKDEDGNEVATGSSTAAAAGDTSGINFTPIDYNAAGDYTYVVTENASDNEGIKSNSQSFTVKVHVADNGDGTLTATLTDDSDSIAFENEYAAKAGTFTPTATKTLTGKNMLDGEFAFTVKEGDKVVSTGLSSAAASGIPSNIIFGAITYTDTDTDTGDHTYTITENPVHAGVTPGGESYEISVNVSDDGNGHLVASTAEGTPAIAFTNSYSAENATLVLEGSKTLNGRDMDAGEFNFVVKEGQDTVATGTNTAATNGQPSTFKFTPITYTEIGTHNYTVSEVEQNGEGITVGGESYNITVNVADNGSGQLVATVTSGSAQMAFTNSYTADPTSITLAGSKTLNGKSMGDKEFSFSVKENGSEVAKGYSTPAYSGKASKIIFDKIEYKQPGTHTYTITEDPSDNEGIVVNNQSFTIVVNVTDDKAGHLNATIDSSKSDNNIDFVNTYSTKGTSYNIIAKKILKGKDLIGGEFAFTATPMNVDDSPIVMTKAMASTKATDSGAVHATNKVDGSVVFDTLTFSEAGTYSYLISEDKGTESNVTYSQDVYKVEIVVADNGSGKLEVKSAQYSKLDKDSFTNVDTAEFTNTYTAPVPPTPQTSSVKVTKVWDDDNNATGQRPGKVTVNLMNGTTVVASQNLTADNNWTYTFTGLDKSVNYTVTEDAVDNYAATVAGGNDANGNGDYTITNTLKNEAKVVSKTVKKVWNDDNDKAGKRPGSIKVQLYADGVATGNPVTITKAMGWKYTWKELQATKAGKQITYTVKEVGSVEGYKATYSDDTFTITNNILSNGGGNSGKPDNNNSNGHGNGTADNNNSSGPNTGDQSDLTTQLLILALAVSGLGASIYTMRRRQDD